MVAAQIQYVVGIDVAKQAHVVCALNARTGAVQQRPLTIAATAEGYAQLCALLQAWAEPAALLVGVEATGCLWEPLYDALTAAGYAVLVLNPRQTAHWAASFGLRAKTDGIDAHTLARGLLAGYAQGHGPVRGGAGAACPDAGALGSGAGAVRGEAAAAR
jgi:transposase